MREILFRGKRIDNGEWIEGHYIFVQDAVSEEFYHCIVKSGGEMCVSELWDYEFVDKDTLSEFSGLVDKNGKKIFEGDCFKTYCTGLPVYKHVVGYYPEHFAFMARCIEMNTVHYLSDYRPSAVEVIGNIYDNPELLEVT